MLELSQIREMSRQQALKATRAHKVPFIVEPEDLDEWRFKYPQIRLSFPNIGDYRPKGYELVDTIFCDKIGWGEPGELALTIPAMLRRLKPGFAYAIIEEGEFLPEPN